jgi:hypothetical protein
MNSKRLVRAAAVAGVAAGALVTGRFNIAGATANGLAMCSASEMCGECCYLSGSTEQQSKQIGEC